jgi:hypothetical protein
MRSPEPAVKAFFWVTAGRLGLFMLLLAAVLLYQRICPDCNVSTDSLSLLLGAAFMLTALYLFWYKKKGLTRGLKLTTVINDVALASAALYLTGGSQSPFIFLFPIAIITACLIGGQRLGTISALLNTVAFAMTFWFSVDPARDLPKQLFHFSANMNTSSFCEILTSATSSPISYEKSSSSFKDHTFTVLSLLPLTI